MQVQITKAAIRRAYTAARVYVSTHADKYGRQETAIRLSALRIVRDQLIYLLDQDAPRAEFFEDFAAFEKWFLDGARDVYQLVSGGGSAFPFQTAEVFRLFYTPDQAARYRRWAAGEGPESHALSDPMRVQATYVSVALAHMWAALKATYALYENDAFFKGRK